MGVNLGECLSFGWERFKNNPGFYIVWFLLSAGIQFAFSVVSQIIQSVVMVAGGASGGGNESAVAFTALFVAYGIGFVMSLFAVIAIAPLLAGFFRGVKREYEGGQAEISELFSGYSNPVPAVVACLISFFVIALGTLCCIIPGILLGLLVPLSLCHLADGETSGVEAFKKAFGTLRKEPIIILWNIVLGIIGVLGLFACGVGILVTIPLSMAAFYAVYRQAVDGGGHPGHHPSEDVVEVTPESV